MKSKTTKINFQNKNNEKSYFDLIKIEDVLENEQQEFNSFKNHTILFYSMLIFTEGEGIHTINYHDYHYEEGTIFTLKKDTIHKFSPNKSKGYLLIFTENFIVSYLSEFESLKLLQVYNEMLFSPKVQLDSKTFIDIKNLVKQLNNEYFEKDDVFSPSLIRSFLHIITTILYRIKSRGNHMVENKLYLNQFNQFQKLVNQYCFQSRKVLFYSKKMGVTPKTLSNITKNIYNKPAKSFIDDILILQIKRLLLNSKLTIKEIAFKVGFEDSTNFFNYFKKQTNLTPKQFITKNK